MPMSWPSEGISMAQSRSKAENADPVAAGALGQRERQHQYADQQGAWLQPGVDRAARLVVV